MMQNLKDILKQEIVAIDTALEEDLDRLKAENDPLLDEVLRYTIFNGGKRVRPILVLLSSRFCGEDSPDLLKLAIAFEYLHVATLLHDDVIDHADTRRGKPSVNSQFGLVAAILAGDFLLARSMTIVGELAGQPGLKVFCDATRAMVDGEFVQLRNAEQYNLSEEKYFEAIQGKTAKLISAACEVGCIFAGGTTAEQESFRKYGSNLGAAFQIVDDLLDYLGDASTTGKAVGNDLVEGKVTLPLILALKEADEESKKTLLTCLESEENRKNSFTVVTELVEKNNGFSGSKKRAEFLIEEAKEQIQSLTCRDQKAAVILVGLAEYILSRNK